MEILFSHSIVDCSVGKNLLPEETYSSSNSKPQREQFVRLRVVSILKRDVVHNDQQSELPRPIPRNSVELDHGCTSSLYFDDAGDNVTLTLYNVTLT